MAPTDVNHREHDETEGQCDADMCNCTVSRFVDDNRAGAGKDESERLDEFRRELLHALVATQCSSQKDSILSRI